VTPGQRAPETTIRSRTQPAEACCIRLIAGFARRGIPLVRQLVVAEPFRRQGTGTLLLDAAEQLARDRRIASLDITVGLFDDYGPARRLYARRGYTRATPPAAAAHARASSRCANGCRSRLTTA